MIRLERFEHALRPWWARAIALFLFALALSTFAWWTMLVQYPATQNGDGQNYLKLLEAGWVSVRRYHEFPHWNPYDCGGHPLWDNPESLAGAPLTWLVFVLGGPRTIEVWILLHVTFGFLSMWLFARHELRLGRVATLVASAAWAYSGFHQHHYSGGHITFVGFLYFPLALLLWRRAENDRRFAAALGFLLAWMFYEGAAYPLPHLLVLLTAETLVRLAAPRRLPKILVAAAVAGLVAFTVAASRLLPVLDQFGQHRRNMIADADAAKWSTISEMFLARQHGRFVVGQQYVWTEWATYVGPIILLLALAGVILGGTETAWMLALATFAFVLMLGHFATWSPWSVLQKHVPPFNQMRVPSRFRAEVSLFIAAFAGVAVERAVRLARRWAPPNLADAIRTAVIGVALIGVGDVISVGLTVIQPFFSSPPEAIVVPSTRLHFLGDHLAAHIDQPRQNRGQLTCTNEWAFGGGAQLWPGDVPQAKPLDPTVKVEVANRTQNTFTADVVVEEPGGRVLFNTPYDDDWKTSVGMTANYMQTLAITLPAGHHVVRVKCWPRLFDAGVALTFVGVAGTIAFLVWETKRRARAA